MQTVQSTLNFQQDYVKKVYNKKFKFYKKINYDSELRVIEKFKESQYCVKIWDTTPDGYTMERLNFDLGNDRTLNTDNIRRIFFVLSLDEILNMLDNIYKDLQKYGVRHRDINPGNILWSENERLLKLTDFFWSDLVNNKVKCPDAVNQIYTRDDKQAIEKIKNEIKKFYEPLTIELDKVYQNFMNVGKGVIINGKGRNAKVSGSYKDGSSIHAGWSYHVVDIPFFRKIQHHKKTCIDEYKLIKSCIIAGGQAPKSILDIGCSTGYQIFNFIKDFKLERAYGYEADPEVLKFLLSCKNIFRLNEAEFELQFDDTIEKKVDVTIWLNSHMWVYKQLGRDRTLQSVRNVIKNSKWLFFQTAGNYSSSIYKVKEYNNPKDIKNMLLEAGGKSVKQLETFIGMHGAPRDMFLVEGK